MSIPAESPILCRLDYGVGNERTSSVTNYHAVHLGAIDLIRYEGVGVHCGNRRLHHVREDVTDDFLITLPVDARIEFQQAGRTDRAGPGKFVVLSTARPFQGSVSGFEHRPTFSALHMRVSGALLRERIPYIERCCDSPLSIQRGAGNIMRGLLELAIREYRALPGSQRDRAALMLIDAVAMAILDAPELRSMPTSTPRNSLARVRAHALRFIEANLSNPALTTLVVAAHCSVTPRYVQTAFAAIDRTVRTVIRDMRLDRCRAALASPQLRDRSVTQIGLSWGFNDLAYFSRAYKARFAVSPRQDRSIRSVDA